MLLMGRSHRIGSPEVRLITSTRSLALEHHQTRVRDFRVLQVNCYLVGTSMPKHVT